MPELSIAGLLLWHLQKPYSVDILVPMLNSHLPSLATKSTLVPAPTFSADPGAWCLVSQCTPLRAAHWCVKMTIKANNLSVSLLGMVFTYSTPFFMVKLFLTRNIARPSSKSECSPMHLLSSASLFLQSNILSCVHPLPASSQQCILTLCLCLVGHMLGCQPEGTCL